MIYDARQVANWFVERAAKEPRVLSIMSLLKLAYIAHGWHLALFDRALFDNRIEAWQYGPVIPDIYNAFRMQGIQSRTPVSTHTAKFESECESFLDDIYRIYGSMSPFRLSELTHVPGGPWEISIRIGGLYAEIPDDLIKLHYVEKKLAANEANGI